MSGQIEEISTDLEEVEADRELFVQAFRIQKERAEKFAAIMRQHGIQFDD